MDDEPPRALMLHTGYICRVFWDMPTFPDLPAITEFVCDTALFGNSHWKVMSPSRRRSFNATKEGKRPMINGIKAIIEAVLFHFDLEDERCVVHGNSTAEMELSETAHIDLPDLFILNGPKPIGGKTVREKYMAAITPIKFYALEEEPIDPRQTDAQLWRYARNIEALQDERSYSFTLGFREQVVQLFLYINGVQYYSRPVNINQEPQLFVHLILFCCFPVPEFARDIHHRVNSHNQNLFLCETPLPLEVSRD